MCVSIVKWNRKLNRKTSWERFVEGGGSSIIGWTQRQTDHETRELFHEEIK